jgi:hypothetical protein
MGFIFWLTALVAFMFFAVAGPIGGAIGGLLMYGICMALRWFIGSFRQVR